MFGRPLRLYYLTPSNSIDVHAKSRDQLNIFVARSIKVLILVHGRGADIPSSSDIATSARPGEFAFGMEGKVFQQVLEIGRTVIVASLTAQAAFYRAKTAPDPDGSELAYSGERRGTCYSVFGEIIYSRSNYGGAKGFHPMDAAINLPPKGSSDFVRKMTEELAVNCSFELATTFMARHFPLATCTSLRRSRFQKPS